MSFFRAMNISASGLTAQSARLDVIAENIANVSTTKTEDGTPYKAKSVLFQEKDNTSFTPFSDYFNNAVGTYNNGQGVRVSSIVEDSSQGELVFDPEHPDADENGYVEQSNVNIVKEMVNMISASRAYESNITAMNTTKSMVSKTMEIGQ
ncbi:MAG: flagellar basal body rod protein FlgC [Lachnospirales bacterium]